MKQQIIKKLESLKSSVLLYGNQHVTIKRYEMNDERERVFIYFNEIGTLDRPYSSALSLLSMLEPLQLEDVHTTHAPPVILTKAEKQEIIFPSIGNNDMLDKANEILFADYEKIKNGEIAIDKAQAMGKTIDQIIEIEKTKLAKAAVMAKFMGR